MTKVDGLQQLEELQLLVVQQFLAETIEISCLESSWFPQLFCCCVCLPWVLGCRSTVLYYGKIQPGRREIKRRCFGGYFRARSSNWCRRHHDGFNSIPNPQEGSSRSFASSSVVVFGWTARGLLDWWPISCPVLLQKASSCFYITISWSYENCTDPVTPYRTPQYRHFSSFSITISTKYITIHYVQCRASTHRTGPSTGDEKHKDLEQDSRVDQW